MSRELVISFSGGKDSTELVHWLLEHGEEVAAMVAFDTGWEWPQMHDHWQMVEENTSVPLFRVHPEVSFDDYFFRLPVRASRDYPDERVAKGEVRYHGYGWPSWTRRWCTDIKTRALDRFVNARFPGAVQCIGFAADERHRTESKRQRELQEKGRVRYPLIEAGITEKEALERCFSRGYHWGGLYGHFGRVSCFCCPLKSRDDCRKIRSHYPEQWQQMLDMDSRRPPHNQGFHGRKSVHDLDAEFAQDEAQMTLFSLVANSHSSRDGEVRSGTLTPNL